MEAIEYLLSNIPTKYTYFPGILGFKKYTENSSDVLEFLNSSNVDGAILRGLPSYYVHLCSHYREIFALQMYIQNEVMLRMTNSADVPKSTTELVKLRIAVNKINSLSFLSKDERIAWSSWVKELYWERKKILHKWYLEYILPF